MNTTANPSHLSCSIDAVNCTKCISRYSGEFCEIDLLELPGITFFVALIYATLIINTMIQLVWNIYGLCTVQKKTSLVSLALVMCFVSIVLRGIFTADFLGWFFYSKAFKGIVYWISMSLLFGCCNILFAILSNIALSIKKMDMRMDWNRPKVIVFIVLVVEATVTVLSMVVGGATQDWLLASTINNVLVVFMTIGLIVMSAIYIPLIDKVLKDVVSSKLTKIRHIRSILFKLAILIPVTVLLILPTILKDVLFSPNDGIEYAVISLSQHFLSRVIEITATYFILKACVDTPIGADSTHTVSLDEKKTKSIPTA